MHSNPACLCCAAEEPLHTFFAALLLLLWSWKSHRFASDRRILADTNQKCANETFASSAKNSAGGC